MFLFFDTSLYISLQCPGRGFYHLSYLGMQELPKEKSGELRLIIIT